MSIFLTVAGSVILGGTLLVLVGSICEFVHNKSKRP
jgi:hypothetical protein